MLLRVPSQTSCFLEVLALDTFLIFSYFIAWSLLVTDLFCFYILVTFCAKYCLQNDQILLSMSIKFSLQSFLLKKHQLSCKRSISEIPKGHSCFSVPLNTHIDTISLASSTLTVGWKNYMFHPCQLLLPPTGHSHRGIMPSHFFFTFDLCCLKDTTVLGC